MAWICLCGKKQRRAGALPKTGVETLSENCTLQSLNLFRPNMFLRFLLRLVKSLSRQEIAKQRFPLKRLKENRVYFCPIITSLSIIIWIQNNTCLETSCCKEAAY